MDYIIVDIETNGPNPENDDILLISAVKISGENIVDTFSKLVKPSRPQTEHFEIFTGITNKDLECADEICDVLEEFREFSNDATIVSYDDFEYFFLNSKGFEAQKVIYLRDYIRKTYPNLNKYIADGVIISLGLQQNLQECMDSLMFSGKTRLLYALKVSVIFLNIIKNF